MDQTLKELISSIKPLDSAAMDKAAEYHARLAKPPGSLGKLEALSIQLAGITGRVHNELPCKHLVVFASDNGVVAEGVSSAPQSVTLQQTVNLAHARTGASVLAKHFGARLTVCDVGVNADIKDPNVLNRKISYGTKNIRKMPAMMREQAEEAILIGAGTVMDLAFERETGYGTESSMYSEMKPVMDTGAETAKDAGAASAACPGAETAKDAGAASAACPGADVFGIGEMGIGNTTTSSAVLAVLLDADVEEVTGRGGGITDEAFRVKKEVIRDAIRVNCPEREDVIDVLSKVGGYDIAAMCGAFLGAAAIRRPAVIDGFISAVAALCAVRLCPDVRGYLIPSHASFEKGYPLAMRAMNLEPFLLLDMRLGEGSGCPIAFQILDAACAVINKMATFDEAGIDDEYLEEIRRGDKFTP